jgi:Uncharacterized conserved protein
MKMASCGFLLLMGLLASAGLIWEAGAQGITFQKTNLTLFNLTGRHEFIVDVANASNASQTQLGLRYRHDIPPDGGLLTLQSLAAPGLISISTDGQALPVDLLFIASDGTVMEVHSCIPTDSSTPITSTSPVGAALELACGTVIRYGILAGDHVLGGGLGPR